MKEYKKNELGEECKNVELPGRRYSTFPVLEFFVSLCLEKLFLTEYTAT